VAAPAAHRAKRKRRWWIALGFATLSALSALSLGVPGPTHPAVVLVLAAFAIEPLYWLREWLPIHRVWTDDDVLGVEGAAEVRNHPQEPVPLASIAAFTVYPMLGGSTPGGG